MLAYIKNRRVPLCGTGGVPLEPMVVLPPLTKVEVDADRSIAFANTAAPALGSAWVMVKVVGGSHDGKEGWVGGASLFGIASGYSYPGGSTRLTGFAYGDDQLLWDGEEVALWKPNCPHCGLDPESHRIVETRVTNSSLGWTAPLTTTAPPSLDEDGRYQLGKVVNRFGESNKGLKQRLGVQALNTGADARKAMVNAPRGQGTADDAARLYALLAEQSGKMKALGFGPKEAVMIGVLHVAESDNVYASHSGKHVNSDFQKVCATLGFLYAGPVEKPVRTRYGDDAHTSISDPSLFQCAAPRLIQAAIRDREYPCGMTEVWYEPGERHNLYLNNHTIESCDLCRTTVPLMLCPDEAVPADTGSGKEEVT